MLHNIHWSGLAASAVTVGYALGTLELVQWVGAELPLSAWHQVCCTASFGLLGPMLHSHPPRDLDGDLMDLVLVARTILLIDHIRSGIRLDLSARRDGLGVRTNALVTKVRTRKPEFPGPLNLEEPRMWDFNWGIFWALVAYGALKFGVKRALGLYGARATQKQPRHKPFHVDYVHGK